MIAGVQMRGLDEVRQILGPFADRYTDEELLDLRDAAYRIAEVLVEEVGDRQGAARRAPAPRRRRTS